MTGPSQTQKNMSLNDGEELMSELRKYLMLMAILAATVTYVAGLNPPGGVWLASEDGHLTGNQILVVTHHARYNAFYYSNAIAFMASVVVILLLLLERSVTEMWWLFSLRVVLLLDLLALMVAYAAGASRGTFTTAYASVLVSAVSIYAMIHIFKHIRRLRAQGAGQQKTPTLPPPKPDPKEDEERERMERLRKIFVLFAVFAATVTYTAGLNPPGGFWPDSQDGHRAGDPVLQDFHHSRRFIAFFIFNSAAFAASLVAVMLLTSMNRDPNKKKESFHDGWRRFPVAYLFVLVALLGLLVAYAVGSSRKTHSTIYVFCLFLLLLGCIIAQFLIQKFWWGSICKLGQSIKSLISCCGSHANNEEEPDQRLKEAHDLVLLLATLAATITYQAGMNPPGGFWPDDRDGHKGGDPILLTTHARRYKVFFYCNSVALVASIVVIAMVLSRHLRRGVVHKYHALEAAMILDLLSLVAAYAIGCCRDVGTSLHVIALAAGVLVYVLIHMVFFTLEHSSKKDKKMKKKRKLLLLIAILAATVTYQAGLNPPGAFWLEDGELGQAAGYAVLATNYPRRYMAFFYCNATSFVASIAIILLLANPHLYQLGIKCYVLYVCAVAGLSGLAVAYAAGSSRHMRTSVVVIALAAVVFLFVALLLLLLWRKKKKTTEQEAVNNTTPNNNGQPQGGVESKKEEPSDEEKKKKEIRKYMYTTRKYLMLVAILVASVTYQAGLTPPGGVWPDSIDGHAAGNPVLRDSNKRRYSLFFYSNSVSFLASVLVILLLVLDEPLFGEKKDKKKKGLIGMGCEELLRVAQSSILVALLGLLFAYAAGCSREWETSGYVAALVAAVLLYIVIHVLLSCYDHNKSTVPAEDGECKDLACRCKCHGKDGEGSRVTAGQV